MNKAALFSPEGLSRVPYIQLLPFKEALFINGTTKQVCTSPGQVTGNRNNTQAGIYANLIETDGVSLCMKRTPKVAATPWTPSGIASVEEFWQVYRSENLKGRAVIRETTFHEQTEAAWMQEGELHFPCRTPTSGGEGVGQPERDVRKSINHIKIPWEKILIMIVYL